MSVASAAVGPASGFETEDTGVRSRPGCTWRCIWHGFWMRCILERSMCTVSRLDAEPAAALAWEADPLGALNSLFAVRWRMMWSLMKSKLSLVHFCLSVSCGSPWPDFI